MNFKFIIRNAKSKVEKEINNASKKFLKNVLGNSKSSNVSENEEFSEVESLVKGNKTEFQIDNEKFINPDLPNWMNEDESSYVLAVQGNVFNELKKCKDDKNPISIEIFKKVLSKCQVFARMKPDEKANLIIELRADNPKFLIGMVGDGANDCKALKVADLGISLSDAEASIAAPFTSKKQDISCVTEILKLKYFLI